MKFIAITSVLFAALACAQPVVELTEPVGLEEAAPQLVGAAEKRALAKRAIAQFIVYPTGDCSGGGTTITANGGTKGNFNPAQHSIKILQLNNGYHLTLYTGSSQSGVLTRFGATEVGADKCYTGSWLSNGVYAN